MVTLRLACGGGTPPLRPARTPARLGLIAVAVLLLATAAFSDEGRTARLETLCRVWATAKYAHPAMSIERSRT